MIAIQEKAPISTADENNYLDYVGKCQKYTTQGKRKRGRGGGGDFTVHYTDFIQDNTLRGAENALRYRYLHYHFLLQCIAIIVFLLHPLSSRTNQ